MANVMLLAWIGQLLLFFVVWRLFYFASLRLRKGVTMSLWAELIFNLIVAIVLLVLTSTLPGAWWGMAILGIGVGVFSGQISGRSQSKD